MNYLALIQAVSKIKTGEEPSIFGDTSDEDYLKIKEEINNALRDFYLSYEWQFRNKSTTFNTVAYQQSYTITWDGSIKDGGVLYPSSSTTKYEIIHNPSYNDFIKDVSYGDPTQYTIYNSSILLNPIPDEVKAITVNYLNDNWATDGANPATEKTSLSSENDVPNFNSKWHYIVVYGALDRLFYNDPVRKAEYMKRYSDMYSMIIKESEKSYEGDNRLHFITTDWI